MYVASGMSTIYEVWSNCQRTQKIHIKDLKMNQTKLIKMDQENFVWFHQNWSHSLVTVLKSLVSKMVVFQIWSWWKFSISWNNEAAEREQNRNNQSDLVSRQISLCLWYIFITFCIQLFSGLKDLCLWTKYNLRYNSGNLYSRFIRILEQIFFKSCLRQFCSSTVQNSKNDAKLTAAILGFNNSNHSRSFCLMPVSFMRYPASKISEREANIGTLWQVGWNLLVHTLHSKWNCSVVVMAHGMFWSEWITLSSMLTSNFASNWENHPQNYCGC